MATPMMSWSKIKVKSVIWFLAAKGLKSTEILCEINSACGDESNKIVISNFKGGHKDVKYKVHPRPFFLQRKRTIKIA